MSSFVLARIAARLALGCAALLIGACSTTGTSSGPGVYGGPVTPPPGPGATAPAGTPGPATPPPATPLATEQRYFEDWFRGTPVVIAAQANATPPTLAVDVPLAHSFDAGKADIKPALGAVLEKVAESLRRQVGARITIAAPSDPGGAPALAQSRAERVREHLVARRIAAPRIALGSGGRAGAPLQLRMTIPSAAFPQAVSRYQSPNVVPARGIARVAATQADAPDTKR